MRSATAGSATGRNSRLAATGRALPTTILDTQYGRVPRKIGQLSKAKIRFQSFFMLMTIQPSFFASS